MMIRQLPHGGMSTGIIGRVMGRDELAEVRGELWGAYRDRIWAEARRRGAVMMSAQAATDSYARHIRFEHGTVREMPAAPVQRRPAVAAPEADPWEAVAGALREGLAPDPRQISGAALAELFLAYHADATRGGLR